MLIIYGDDPINQKHTVGALYAMSPPNSIASKKAGEWNQYHITVNYKTNQGKVILNGIEINNFPLSGDKWDAMVKIVNLMRCLVLENIRKDIYLFRIISQEPSHIKILK